MNTTDKLADAVELAEEAIAYVPAFFADKHGMTGRLAALKESLADHEAAAQAAAAVFLGEKLAVSNVQPKGTADLYVGLIERLMTLSTRLGIAYEPGVESFGASIEDRLYAICRSTERLLDSLSAKPPAQQATQGAEPSPGLLMSMAIRYDHALGLPGYYDSDLFKSSGVTHAQRLESTLRTMRQLWEEATGRGFYSPEREAEYVKLAGASGGEVQG